MEYEDIKKLMDDMGDSKLDTLDIEFPDGIKISMSKNKNSSNLNIKENTAIVEETSAISSEEQIEIDKNEQASTESETENIKIIKSPMVGTFYSSSTPDNPPFVEVGSKVKKGDTLCIIEAMKLMNEIESEYDGEIVEIFVINEDMVEYGMPLFKCRNLGM